MGDLGWGKRAAALGLAGMMTFNRGAMPPRSYRGYNNPIAPIHRGVEDEEDLGAFSGFGSIRNQAHSARNARFAKAFGFKEDEEDLAWKGFDITPAINWMNKRSSRKSWLKKRK